MSLEEWITYGTTFLFIGITVFYYVYKGRRESNKVRQKVAEAKEAGRYEPNSLHPYIDLSLCIGSASCIKACPEKDILGLIDNQATVINATQCVGHGACFHSCPVDAISLRIGTEKRGVELPHVKPNYETNISGIYIAGELGGMGLIKNSVEQGKQAVQNIASQKIPTREGAFDVVIVGAGPAGIGAGLMAKKHQLSFKIVEQESLGGTVFTFPRSKVVMTHPMDLPLYGKVKLTNTTKSELLEFWNDALTKNEISISEHSKVEEIIPQEKHLFKLKIKDKEPVIARNIVIAIGRRGSPRKLGVPGEESSKVAYRLLEPETMKGEKIMVVGGGDSAVESALLLMENNEVSLSYRKEAFARIKPQNQEAITQAIVQQKIKAYFSTNVAAINPNDLMLKMSDHSIHKLPNDRVFIFIGGELPIGFLKQAGINVEKNFGKIVKRH